MLFLLTLRQFEFNKKMPIPRNLVNRHSPAGADAPVASTVSPASGRGRFACTGFLRNKAGRHAANRNSDPSHGRPFRLPDGIAEIPSSILTNITGGGGILSKIP
jgi:hypothetical protein